MAQTGIVWGGWNGNLRIGFNFRWNDIGAGTTSTPVYVDWYVDSGSFRYEDNQTLNWGGAFGGTVNFYKGGTGTVLVHTTSLGNVGTSYGGGPSWSFNVWLTGAYNGSAPSASWTFTLPARPASVPSVPGSPTFSNVTSSNIRVSSATPSNNGSAIVEWQFQRATNSGFTSGVATLSHNGYILDIGGLARATTYYFRVRVRNGVGWSGWSSVGSRATLATPPDAPTAAPRVEGVFADALAFSWVAPNNGGSAVTGYDLQVSTTTSFATAKTVSTTATSVTVDDLMPATGYYARVRAKNARGAGAWSPVQSADTLSSLYVKVGGQWLQARVWVKTGGVWVRAKAWKKSGGAWRL